MPNINYQIQPQGFEVIRDQIATILKDELVNQGSLDPNFREPEVFINKMSDPQPTELPLVNVQTHRGNYENQSVKHAIGIYRYTIDCYEMANSDDQQDGGKLSGERIDRLMGVVRHILMHDSYITLGFKRGSINRRYFTDFQVPDPEPKDEYFLSMGRWEFNVEYSEPIDITIQESLVSEIVTQVYLEETVKGYKWKWVK